MKVEDIEMMLLLASECEHKPAWISKVAKELFEAFNPEGFVQVPIIPTEEMIYAMHHQIDWCRNDQNTYGIEDVSQKPNGVGTFCREDIVDAWNKAIEVTKDDNNQ